MLSPEQGWPEGSQYTLLLSVSFWNCIWRRLKSDSKLGISSFPSILTATIQTYLFFILSYSSTQMSPTTVSFLPFMFHTTFKIIFLKHWYNQKFFIFFNTPPLLAGYDLNVSRFLALVLVLVCGGCFLLVLYLKKKKKNPSTLWPKTAFYPSMAVWFHGLYPSRSCFQDTRGHRTLACLSSTFSFQVEFPLCPSLSLKRYSSLKDQLWLPHEAMLIPTSPRTPTHVQHPHSTLLNTFLLWNTLKERL